VSVGLPEVIVILVIVLVLFGARRLPELARSLGRAAGEFRKGLREPPADESGAPSKDDAKSDPGN